MSVGVTDREGNYHIYGAATHWVIEADGSLSVRHDIPEPDAKGRTYKPLAGYAPGAWVCAESSDPPEEA